MNLKKIIMYEHYFNNYNPKIRIYRSQNNNLHNNDFIIYFTKYNNHLIIDNYKIFKYKSKYYKISLSKYFH